MVKYPGSESSRIGDDWELAHLLMKKYINLLEERYEGDKYINEVLHILKKNFYEPDDFSKRWNALNREQRTSLMENIGRGANSLITDEEKKQEKEMWIKATEKLDKELTQDIVKILEQCG